MDHVLERKGFSTKWRSWIRGCLLSTSFAVLVNRNAKCWVKDTRGLRQRDPLFPFLHTIVADVLSRMMMKREESGLTKGFIVDRDNTSAFFILFYFILFFTICR